MKRASDPCRPHGFEVEHAEEGHVVEGAHDKAEVRLGGL